MDPERLPEPDDLWWSWVALAVLQRALGPTPPDGSRCGFDPEHRVVRLDLADGSWLRLQRSLRRHVLWGRSADAPPAPPDARRDAPAWALSGATEEGRPTFLAWHAHGEWDSAVTVADPGVEQLLRPLLSVDPRLAARVAAGTLSADGLEAHLSRPARPRDVRAALDLARAAASPAPLLAPGAVAVRLRDQVHRQMREAPEADRMLMQRPPSVVRWAAVHGPATPYEYAVMVRREQLVPAVDSTRLPATARRSLMTVLQLLRGEESAADHGAWLFARVVSDGVVVDFDRCFDGWPSWWRATHPSQGPALGDLTWEMQQRTPAWRPTWASLLPAGETADPAASADATSASGRGHDS